MKKSLFLLVIFLFSFANANLIDELLGNNNSLKKSADLNTTPSYTCGVFKSALNSYQEINGNQDIKICGNYALVSENNTTDIQCSAKSQCTSLSTCNIKKPFINIYNPIIYDSNKINEVESSVLNNTIELNASDYKDYTGDENIDFKASKKYNDSNRTYMTLGNFELNGTDKTYQFTPGDYFFENLIINGSGNKIELPDNNGTVRIFIKGDLNITNPNIQINNDDSDNVENKLFIYVGNNFNLRGSSEDNSTLKGFVYVKGNVEINSTTGLNWYGALTAEKDINITGNKNFYYIAPTEKSGYQDCALCYADKMNGHWLRIMEMLRMTFNIRTRSAIINQSNMSLNDLNVTLVETDPSWFTATTPQMYRLINENNNTVFKTMENNTTYAYRNGLTGIGIKKNIINKGKGVVFAPPRGDIQPPVTSNEIATVSKTTAHLGDYNATGFEHYNAIETTFGIDTTIFGNNLHNFFANYYDSKGRYYKNIKLGYCEDIPTSDADPYNDIAGVVDSWDIDENINNRIIKTKIVNKSFKLKIAGIKNDQESALNKGIIKYALYDIINRSEITPFYDFDTSNSSIEHEFNINLASKDIKVEFKICADVDDNGTLIVKDSSECQNANEYRCKANPGNTGWRKCFSSDDFAIRPYKFVIENIPAKVKAAEQFNIKIKALDYQNNPVNNYNETVSVVNSPRLRYIDNNPNANRLLEITSNRTFSGGVVNLALKYPEVGEGVIKIDEVNGSEYGYVDEDDTPDSQRIIQSSAFNIKFIPFNFKIDAKYSNFDNSSFTYLSNDFNMSSNLDINITALNKDGNVTEYYNSGMYAKNTVLKVSHSVPTGIGSVKYLETSQNIIHNTNINNPIQLAIDKGYFTVSHKGKAYIHLKINFPRSPKKPVNNFNFIINDINITDNDSNGSKNLNQNAKFYYGRIAFDNISGYSFTLKGNAKYEYWTNAGWVTNTDHSNNTFGEIKYLYIKPSDVNYSKDTLSDALQKLTLSTSHTLPYKVKIHVAVPSWLWYHPLAQNYQDPSSANQNCLTHPCFKVSFLSESDGWGGIGIQEPKYEETNRTAEINSSLKTLNTDKKTVKKLNW